jgi:hypothetical protein
MSSGVSVVIAETIGSLALQTARHTTPEQLADDGLSGVSWNAQSADRAAVAPDRRYYQAKPWGMGGSLGLASHTRHM